MSKQYILKDIEKLKQANTFLETLFADIEMLKDMDEVLDVYFDKVFKYNKEEY